MKELHLRYRPKKIESVYGQPEAVSKVKAMLGSKIKHCILLTGPSGCGKTTIARILAKHLRCSDFDFKEYNCADKNGIDFIRNMKDGLDYKPIQGSARVLLLDECHRLTGDAQDAALKMLEEPRPWNYFILATTDPRKLKETVRTRCTQITVKALTPSVLRDLVASVVTKEGLTVSEEVIEKVAEKAEGSARKALVLLDSVIGIEDDEERLEAIESADEKKDAIELCRVLANPRAQWGDVAKVLKGIQSEEPEGLRRLTLSYFTKILLGGGKLAGRAEVVLDFFQDEWLTGCGFAGLVLACRRVIQSK